MPDKVKCKDCGFLAVRHFQTRELLDAEQLFRDRGYIPNVKLDIRGEAQAYDDHPICFMRATDFRSPLEIGPSASEETRAKAVRIDRDCDRFTPWLQGFTPREHLEMIQERDRLSWQAEREAADKAESAERDRVTREFQADQARLADERHREALIAAADREGKNQSGQWKRTLFAVFLGGTFTLVAVWLREIMQSPEKPLPTKSITVPESPPAKSVN